jgi:hypothetical protein
MHVDVVEVDRRAFRVAMPFLDNEPHEAGSEGGEQADYSLGGRIC